ncbi:DNA methyltransferase [Vibrio phage EniLVp02]
MRISKAERAKHEQIVDLLEKDTLTQDEREWVIENLNEAAICEITRCGAFFTPIDYAFGLAFELGSSHRSRSLLDLCSGIGLLAYAAYHHHSFFKETGYNRIVCVEQNYDFVKIGKKLLPQATWIHGSIDDDHVKEQLTEIVKEHGEFDDVISNPPYGIVPSMKDIQCPRYTGKHAHFKVMDIASQYAGRGTFIIPQNDAGFRYSGVQNFERVESSNFKKFVKDTGWRPDIGMGQDTTVFPMFKNTKIQTEIVVIDYYENLIDDAQSKEEPNESTTINRWANK